MNILYRKHEENNTPKLTLEVSIDLELFCGLFLICGCSGGGLVRWLPISLIGVICSTVCDGGTVFNGTSLRPGAAAANLGGTVFRVSKFDGFCFEGSRRLRLRLDSCFRTTGNLGGMMVFEPTIEDFPCVRLANASSSSGRVSSVNSYYWPNTLNYTPTQHSPGKISLSRKSVEVNE